MKRKLDYGGFHVQIVAALVILTAVGCDLHPVPSNANAAETDAIAVLKPLAENLSWHSNGSLRAIDIGGAVLRETELQSILQLQQLEELGLIGTNVTDEDLARIAELPQLRAVGLAWTAISDDGLRQLARCESLVVLDLNHTQISDDGIDALRQLPNLEVLFIEGTNVTERAAQKFDDAMPNCRVQR